MKNKRQLDVARQQLLREYYLPFVEELDKIAKLTPVVPDTSSVAAGHARRP